MHRSKSIRIFLVTVLSLIANRKQCVAQQIVDSLRQQVRILCDSFSGRGYVEKGSERAASYLADQFREYGLKPLNSDAYLQPYSFPVNTFPGSMMLSIDGKVLQPGVDFLVHPASGIVHRKYLKIRQTDLLKEQLQKQEATAQWVQNLDSFLKREGIPEREWVSKLGDGVYLLPKKSKPLWWVATDTVDARVIYLFDSILLHKQPVEMSVNIRNKFIAAYPAGNIAGYIPGTQHPDSFIVITAHYDHLGKMGSDAVFPGASDNASGTAMLLSLAAYYAHHPQQYSIAFILFSGEEAGLLGSFYYVHHPLFPLQRIRFLLNMDIMGDASEGITVVNGSIWQEQLAQLKELNSLLPEPLPDIRARGTAANSDHYPFSEAGVPCIFIYSNGGNGFYHDTWDRPEALSFKNIPSLRQLLINFVNRLNN